MALVVFVVNNVVNNFAAKDETLLLLCDNRIWTGEGGINCSIHGNCNDNIFYILEVIIYSINNATSCTFCYL